MDEEVIGQSPEESEVPEVEVTESETIDGQSEEDTTESTDEYDEVDYDGKKYSVPKELKDAFLRQSDYTRKTQEVAEQRRAFEEQQAQAAEHFEAMQRNIQSAAQLYQVDEQLKQFGQVDWQAFSDQDPVEAQKAWFKYQELQQAKQGLTQQISQAEQQRQFQTQQAIARQLEEGQKALAREIKGWSPEVAKQLREYGKTLGYQDQELAAVVDARAVKTLHKAFLYDQMMKQATTKPDAPQPKPVTKVGQKAGSTKDPDKMTSDEWLKWRESSLRKRA